MRNVTDKSYKENQNKFYVHYNFFPVYEIMWKNIVEPGGTQITIYNTYGFSATTMVARTHLNATVRIRTLPV
jgi:hypothetical protein